MRPAVKGAILGLALGMISFINLPSLSTFVLYTVALTAVFAVVGHLASHRGWKKLMTIGGVVAVVAGLFLIILGGCTLESWFAAPAENPVTGEIETGGYDGFRVMACDKGQWPWYYKSLNETEMDTFCETRDSSMFCRPPYRE